MTRSNRQSSSQNGSQSSSGGVRKRAAPPRQSKPNQVLKAQVCRQLSNKRGPTEAAAAAGICQVSSLCHRGCRFEDPDRAIEPPKTYPRAVEHTTVQHLRGNATAAADPAHGGTPFPVPIYASHTPHKLPAAHGDGIGKASSDAKEVSRAYHVCWPQPHVYGMKTARRCAPSRAKTGLGRAPQKCQAAAACAGHKVCTHARKGRRCTTRRKQP